LIIILAALLLTAAGCSGRNDPGTDASTDGSLDGLDGSDGTGPAAPTPPEAPSPPVLTPCPDGWREIEDTDTGAVTCDPWPEGGAHECEDDEAHFPGDPGCTTIGTPCGTDDWATDLPTDRTIIYVLAGAPSGGDGSETSPHATIAEAMSGADPGDVVALSKGTFDEVVVVGAGVTLWGACTAETLVSSSTPNDMSGTIVPARSDTEVRNLTISGERPGVFNGVSGRTMALSGVIIRDARTNGVYTYGTITLQNVAIRDTRSAHDLDHQGTGIEVAEGGVAEMSRVVLEGNRVAGAYAWGAGSSIVASDMVMRGTLPSETNRDYGYGLIVQAGAVGRVERALIEANRCAGIHVAEGGAFLQASDIVVRDNLPCALDASMGRGILVELGASLELSRAHIASNRDAGVSFATGSHGDLTDVVITGTQTSATDDNMGFGIAVQEASDVRVTRAILEGNHSAGIIASLAGTSMDLVDVSVYGTQRSSTAAYYEAEGVFITSGATATITRAHLEGNVRSGLLLHGPGTSATIFDLTILETVGIPLVNSGFGLWISAGAGATITRALIEGNRDIGVSAEGDGTVLSLTDAMIIDTRSQDGSGLWGRGLQAMHVARVDLTRTVLEHNQEIGLTAIHPGTEVLGTDVVIKDTIERGCASSTCAGFGHGCGLCALGEAHVDLTSFLITGNVLCGVQIGFGADDETGPFTVGGSVDLHDGTVSNSPIGVNVQTGDYDLMRLMEGVWYLDNDTNLDMSVLPVPDMGLEEI